MCRFLSFQSCMASLMQMCRHGIYEFLEPIGLVGKERFVVQKVTFGERR